MRRNKLMAVALAGIMAAGALSGCTGSGSTTPTTAAESKKEKGAAKTEAAGSEAAHHKTGESSGQASASGDEKMCIRDRLMGGIHLPNVFMSRCCSQYGIWGMRSRNH